MKNGKTYYYPRKMRVGWCVAHTINVMGANVEVFGTKYASYQQAFARAEQMNQTTSEKDGAKQP